MQVRVGERKANRQLGNFRGIRRLKTSMSTGKHYFIEKRPDGRFAVLARKGARASRLVDTQKEAERLVKQFNSTDHPDVERVRKTKTGKPDKWRSR